jgi:hypothetical protein
MLRWRNLGQGPYEVVGDLGTNPGDTPRVVHIGRAWNEPLFSIEGVNVRLCCDTRLHVGPVMLAIRCVLFLSATASMFARPGIVKRITESMHSSLVSLILSDAVGSQPVYRQYRDCTSWSRACTTYQRNPDFLRIRHLPQSCKPAAGPSLPHDGTLPSWESQQLTHTAWSASLWCCTHPLPTPAETCCWRNLGHSHTMSSSMSASAGAGAGAPGGAASPPPAATAPAGSCGTLPFPTPASCCCWGCSGAPAPSTSMSAAPPAAPAGAGLAPGPPPGDALPLSFSLTRCPPDIPLRVSPDPPPDIPDALGVGPWLLLGPPPPPGAGASPLALLPSRGRLGPLGVPPLAAGPAGEEGEGEGEGSTRHVSHGQ